MRGKAKDYLEAGPALRITPAYAGKSYGSKSNYDTGKDHPRVCGEKIAGAAKNLGSMGSPPRMRGKGTSKCTQLSYTRITPAYAGKRQMVLVVLDCSRDHPRVCGEKAESYDTLISYTGSPPRMRGKETVLLERFCETGITPACAGKRNSQHTTFTSERDHPRVCGEKQNGKI